VHGNNPTRDWIEGELARHASEQRIKGWRRCTQAWSGAPKWLVDLNPVHVAGDHCGISADGGVALKTYQEAKLFCAALASAEHIYRRTLDEVAEKLERYREAAGLDPGQDDTEYLNDGS
jgi:hypothetical protein